jgi:biotin carboxyl carrier protein
LDIAAQKSPAELAIKSETSITLAKSGPEASNGKSARVSTNHPEDTGRAIRAPIPGVILSVAIREGSEVTIGQDLCTLEAMKMKNSIRSPRKGVIASVHVSAGQAVQHHDILMEFTE